MTNDIYAVGLTWTELQMISLLLPITFSIFSIAEETLDTPTIEHITNSVEFFTRNTYYFTLPKNSSYKFSLFRLNIRPYTSATMNAGVTTTICPIGLSQFQIMVPTLCTKYLHNISYSQICKGFSDTIPYLHICSLFVYPLILRSY